jgi:hypothetical protein
VNHHVLNFGWGSGSSAISTDLVLEAFGDSLENTISSETVNLENFDSDPDFAAFDPGPTM